MKLADPTRRRTDTYIHDRPAHGSESGSESGSGSGSGSGSRAGAGEAEDAAGEEGGGVGKVVDQVARAETAGLLGQPVQPLQPGSLHPLWSPALVADHEVDRRAAAQEPGAGQVRAQVV